jgi:hypothetical protein
MRKPCKNICAYSRPMKHLATFLFLTLLFLNSTPGWSQNTAPEEHAVWDCIVVKYRPNENYPGHGAYDIKIQKLSYLQDSAVIWKREAPESVKALTDVYVLGEEGEYKTGDTIRKVSMGYHFYPIDFYVCDDVFLQNTMAISCKAGFLLLDKRNGRLLIDQPYPVVEEKSDGYFTPETDIVINAGKLSCQLESRCRNGEFTEECGDYLFHFNGHILFVFDTKNKLINTQQGKVKRTIDRKFTTFQRREYKVLMEARKRELEK